MQVHPTDQKVAEAEEDVMAPEVSGTVGAENEGDEIRATDIVFDCPSCGHNLAIDYRGAGLQINCVACGETVLVPIPDGMKIDDLDLSAGELLTQLFQTRRMLLKSEQHVAELEEALTSVKVRRTELEKSRMGTLHRCAEVVNLCQNVLKGQNDTVLTVNRVIALIADEQQR